MKLTIEERLLIKTALTEAELNAEGKAKELKSNSPACAAWLTTAKKAAALNKKLRIFTD